VQLFLYEKLNKQYRDAHNSKLVSEGNGNGTVTFNIAVKQRVE